MIKGYYFVIGNFSASERERAKQSEASEAKRSEAKRSEAKRSERARHCEGNFSFGIYSRYRVRYTGKMSFV